MNATAEPEAISTASSASGFAKAAESPNRTKPANIPAKLIFLGTLMQSCCEESRQLINLHESSFTKDPNKVVKAETDDIIFSNRANPSVGLQNSSTRCFDVPHIGWPNDSLKSQWNWL